jgi:Flagellar assembly protein FliH
METVVASRNPPLTPVRAIFHDVLPAQSIEVPRWMKGARVSSLPPESAAALLYSADARKKQKNGQYSASSSRPPSPRAPGTDPELDARMHSASLAAEVSESWRPPSPAADPLPRIDLAMEEVRTAVAGLQDTRNQLLRELEPQLLALTRMVTERVLETHLPGEHELSQRLVHEGLQALDHNGQAIISLGIGFASQVDSLRARLEQDGIRAEVHVEEHLSSYACRIRTELGAVDESVETRLDKLLATILEGED